LFQVSVELSPGDLRILFEAVAKGNMNNDTAVDDVTITDGTCYQGNYS
jgi:hypothetical protein